MLYLHYFSCCHLCILPAWPWFHVHCTKGNGFLGYICCSYFYFPTRYLQVHVLVVRLNTRAMLLMKIFFLQLNFCVMCGSRPLSQEITFLSVTNLQRPAGAVSALEAAKIMFSIKIPFSNLFHIFCKSTKYIYYVFTYYKG